MTIGIVVVTHDSEEVIRPLLGDLADLRAQLDVQAVVVDSGSSDDTGRLVCESAVAEWLPMHANRGYAAGINRGLAALRDPRRLGGRMEAALVCNADIRLTTPAVLELLRALQADDRIGVVAPRLLDADGATAPSIRRNPSVARTAFEALVGGKLAGLTPLGEIVSSRARYRRSHFVDWASGAVLLVRADCLDDVGPWDESLFLYSEEVDFQQRAEELGWRTWFAADAVVSHRGGAAHVRGDLWALLCTNRVRVYSRRHGPVASRLFWTAALVGQLVRGMRPPHWQAVRALAAGRREVLA